jgi:flagellar biosynthesis/type III secretory pathway protein FliH
MAFTNLVVPFAASALLSIPAAALSQTADWQVANSPTARVRYTDTAPVSYYELRQRAYDQGYRQGADEGEKDARRGDRFNYHDEREYQRADRGYHRSLGDRERYRQIFRDGYAAGYSAAYSRIARYDRYERNDGRPGAYPRQEPYAQQGGYGGYGGYGRYPGGAPSSPVFDYGARDGYEKGLEDARKNRSFDPLRHSWYRSGDRHYNGRYGSREQYKNVYRQGFQRGYERGYEEGRYRWCPRNLRIRLMSVALGTGAALSVALDRMRSRSARRSAAAIPTSSRA